MADVEYLTNAKFYFEIDGITDLVVSKVSRPSIEMQVAGGDAPIGCTKGGVTQTQATIGGVKYSSSVTLTYVAGNEGVQKKLEDWYIACHAESFSGGAVKARASRKTGSLVVYDGDDNEGMRFNFIHLFPDNLKQSNSNFGLDNAGQLAMDTLEMRFTQVIRKA